MNLLDDNINIFAISYCWNQVKSYREETHRIDVRKKFVYLVFQWFQLIASQKI